MKKTKKRISIEDAQHPHRQKAIRILEELMPEFKKQPYGNRWYELEDKLTTIIHSK